MPISPQPSLIQAERRRIVLDVFTLVALAVSSLVLLACESKCPPGRVLQAGTCHSVPHDAAEISDTDGGQISGATDAGAKGPVRVTENAATATAGTQSTSIDAGGLAGSAAMPGEPSSSAGSSGGAASPMTAPACPTGTSPSAEECDGIDNDCDGRVDEDLLEVMCGSSEQGECRRGKRSCKDGAWTECAGAVEPVPEACDAAGLDENCDGMSNEGCACTPGETQECGVAMGACKKGMQTCSPEAAWGSDCADAVQPQAEICDGQSDDDCDGLADDQDTDCQCLNGKVEPCMAGLGACAAGSRMCNLGKWSECMPTMPPSREMCDGIDNDCDGTPDNNARCPSGQVCVNGQCGCRDGTTQDCSVPMASGPCAQGKQTCSSGQWGVCASAVSPEPEACDGADNDCNGGVDDGAPCPNGRACVRNGNAAMCAMCSAATVALDCPEQTPCRQPSCSMTNGACEYLPVEELTPCARTGALEGFCRAGSCEAPKMASGNRLNPGEALMPGQRLVNGIYSVTCQADGNLVMSHSEGSSQVTDWSSGSSGAAAECVMQPDGNLVIYGSAMNVIWASNTATPGTYVGNYLLLGQNTLRIMSPSGSVVATLK